MNPPKINEEDYINFVIATPRLLTATEAERVQPESKNAPAHDAFTRLLTRLEPDAETLWRDSQTQIDLESGLLVVDDSTLYKNVFGEKRFSLPALFGQTRHGGGGHQSDHFTVDGR